MGQKLWGVYKDKRGIRAVEIYGHVTHGIPGIDIIAPLKFARSLKEKMYFIHRSRGIKMPPKRFILCVEDFLATEDGKLAELSQLELPLILLLWSLMGQLPLANLHTCLAGGRISPGGLIFPTPLSNEEYDEINRYLKEHHLIGDTHLLSLGYDSADNSIPLLEIISHIPDMQVIGQQSC